LLTAAVRRGYKEMQEMKRKMRWGALLLSALVLISLFIFIEKSQPNVEHPKLPKVVFYVS
jgi:uncharacterized integral membrane protein